MAALSMTGPLAHALAGAVRPFLKAAGTFDLPDLRVHNKMEHDASFTRLDFRQGDNYTFQPHMLAALLGDAGGGGSNDNEPVTVRSLAATYRRRDAESRASGAPPLPLRLWFVNLVQTVSFLHAADTGGSGSGSGSVARDVVAAFYTDERLPEAVLLNKRKRTLLGLLWKAIVLLFCLTVRVVR